MAHHATPQATCANCHYAFAPDAPREFCPQCGQQNHAVEISFGHVVEEFLEGIFHFDGKVFRTAGLLLFRPGELTRRFLAGQRVPYVPPIRLYVFISFVFFLLLGTWLGHEEPAEHTKAKQLVKIDALGGLKLGSDFDSIKLTPKQKVRLRQRLDSLNRVIGTAISPAAPGVAQVLKKTGRGPSTKVLGNSEASIKTLADHLPANPTDAQVDSVLRKNGDKPDYLHRLIVRRAARWVHSSREEVVHQVLRGGSILLFLLMPLAALLLKGAYFRQHRYYLSHLVFTIHVQCFLFILIALLIGLDKLNAPEWLNNLLSFAPIVYFVVALHTFYQQSWGKTVAKSLLLGAAYSCVLLLVVVLVGVAGAALF
ncbi:DUF3667 domain-containing protein [Hymenobacter coccineus]|uniref:DUF3667 domain-containing protein n=1 Tax=Hymenobacter coccineus TaxID=1908235 RepID=A0A1G1TME3_9BACT|nr:DUF3667 domain-containing protein [Hymenobacter coccineus]OGX92036.1 hypothetical protein BEN49_17600 [Hymenobacter coccineus]